MEITQDSSRARILLVEDDPGDCELTRRALIRDGILSDLHTATDGREALDYLHRRGPFAGAPRPGLVLLDLNLPGMPGKQVLDEMKHDTELRSIPVVVVSTSAREADVAEAYALGCNSYLIKPLEAHQYMETLRRIYDYWFNVSSLPAR